MSNSPAYTKAYYERNKEKIKARAKERYDSKVAKAYYKTHRDHILARQRDYRAKNRDTINAKLRAGTLKWVYGISGEDYQTLLQKQNGLCAICKKVPMPRGNRSRHFCVDHDHKTGKIRGLLCDPCNIALAHLKEDPEIFRSAIAYIESSW